MQKEYSIHIGKEIKAELDRQGRKVDWLAMHLCFERTNAYNIFRRKSINTDLLMQISIILNRDFFALYSKGLQTISTNITKSF